MHLARIAGAAAVVFGCLVGGTSVAAATDRPNVAYVSGPNAPFDSLVTSIRLTDKTPTTALVALADPSERSKDGEVLALNVGEPNVVDDRLVSGDVKRTTVTFPLDASSGHAEVWEQGGWKPAGSASATAPDVSTLEIELPQMLTNAPRYLWLTRRAPGERDDVPVSALFSLNDLRSTAAGGFGASAVAWRAGDGGAFRVASTDAGPQLTMSRASIKLVFEQDPPAKVGDQDVSQVIDVLQIRPEGEAGVAPFRLEIDERQGTVTGYAGTSSTPLTYTPPGTGRPDSGKRGAGTGVGPVTYSKSIGPVKAGTRLELPVPDIELGIGTSLGALAEVGLTRRVALANGQSLFFDGVSSQINQEAPSTTGTTSVKAKAASRLTVSKKTALLAGIVLVALLVAAWSIWAWLRDTEWYRVRSELRRERTDAE